MTKGPWIVDVTETGIYLVDGNEEDVAEFWHSGRHGNSVSEEQAIEHATLCAAAPKLLEALEELLHYAPGTVVLDRASAAISAARRAP